jgi:hypothetical protein
MNRPGVAVLVEWTPAIRFRFERLGIDLIDGTGRRTVVADGCWRDAP